MNEGGADETFVRSQKLELVVHEGEKLFFDGRLTQTGIIADGSNRLVHFLLEEMQRDVFLGPEIVKDGAFGDAGLARNCFRRGGIKAPGLKQRQCGRHNSLPNRFPVLRAPSWGTRRRRPCSGLRFRWRFLRSHKSVSTLSKYMSTLTDLSTAPGACVLRQAQVVIS